MKYKAKHSTLAKIWGRTGENAVFPVTPSTQGGQHGAPRHPSTLCAWEARRVLCSAGGARLERGAAMRLAPSGGYGLRWIWRCRWCRSTVARSSCPNRTRYVLFSSQHLLSQRQPCEDRRMHLHVCGCCVGKLCAGGCVGHELPARSVVVTD